MIALRREETGVLVMELSEHFWPEDLESAIPAVHDVAESGPILIFRYAGLVSGRGTPFS